MKCHFPYDQQWAPKAILGTEASFPAVTSRRPHGTSLAALLALGLVSSGHRLMLTPVWSKEQEQSLERVQRSHHRPDVQKQALSTESGIAPGRDELPAGTPSPLQASLRQLPIQEDLGQHPSPMWMSLMTPKGHQAASRS